MTATAVISLAAVLVLVVMNGFFVAAEFAIVRVRRTRLEELAGRGREGAKRAIELVDRVSEYLTTTQVGITAASLGVGWLAEDAIARLLRPVLSTKGVAVHAIAATFAFLAVTTVLTVIGELVPKNLAIADADRWLIAVARPLRAFHVVVNPVSRIFTAMAGWVQRGLGSATLDAPPLSEEELKLVLSDSHEEGVLTEGEAKIILRAFEFADKRAEEIMVPAEQVDFLSLERSFDENVATARRAMHERMPLCDTDLDSVRGVVVLKDLWLGSAASSNDAFLRVCRPVTPIPEGLSQETILRRLQADRTKFAVVRDLEGRRTLGIVTLDDVLDALVGDVREAKLADCPAPQCRLCRPALTTARRA